LPCLASVDARTTMSLKATIAHSKAGFAEHLTARLTIFKASIAAPLPTLCTSLQADTQAVIAEFVMALFTKVQAIFVVAT